LHVKEIELLRAGCVANLLGVVVFALQLLAALIHQWRALASAGGFVAMVIRLVSAATLPGAHGRCVAVATNGSEKWERVLVSSASLMCYYELPSWTW